MDFVLFVEPLLCLCDFKTLQLHGNIIHELTPGWGLLEALSTFPWMRSFF